MEYRKKYEQAKGHYHAALDTAEQLHHRENAVLHSQVEQHLHAHTPNKHKYKHIHTYVHTLQQSTVALLFVCLL